MSESPKHNPMTADQAAAAVNRFRTDQKPNEKRQSDFRTVAAPSDFTAKDMNVPLRGRDPQVNNSG